MASQVAQDYLKVIYNLQREKERVTTNDIAKTLRISPASVTNMIKKLAQMKLIRYRSYHGVDLLPAGQKIALEVLRHHRLIELYLKESLGYSWDSVHEEAEKLEHHISEDFEDKIFEAMGRPEFDPHGDPIPTKDGKIPDVTYVPLTAAKPGDSLVVKRVRDHDAKMLRYLEEIGLVPKASIKVLDKAPFNGPLTIKIGETRHVVGWQIVENIFVSQAETT